MRPCHAWVPLLLLCSAAWAQGGPNPYLGQAKVYYQGLEYEKCLQRLEQAVRWKNAPKELVDIELYSGLCKYNLGRQKDARDHFQLALQLNREARLPPYTSPKIEALFDEVRAALPRPKEETVAKTEPPADAPKKPDLEPKPQGPHPAAANLAAAGGGRSVVVPATLGGVAVLAAGAGAFMGVRAKQLETEANGAHFESDAIQLGDQARQSALMANVGYGLAAAAASAAIATWFLSGEE